MKKILIFLILLFIPCLVFADSASPLYTTYDVLVSNKSGATAYNAMFSVDKGTKSIVIPFDTKLTVIYETNVEFEYSNKTIDCVIVKYNSIEYAIDANDVTVYSKNINLDDYKKEEKKLYFFQDEVNIYKGPSKVYGKISGKIPKGAVLTTKYYNNDFAYVEYENIKGWIFTSLKDDSGKSIYPTEYNGSVLEKINVKEEIMTIFETELVDTENNKIKVPAETYLNFEYYSDTCVLVNYNNKEYYLYYESVSNSDKNVIMSVDGNKETIATKEIKIYDSLKNKNVIGTIPANEVITVYKVFVKYQPYYAYPSTNCYVNYDGIKGLITYDSAWSINEENTFYSLSQEIQIDLYQYIDDEKPIKTISIIDQYYIKWNTGDWYYIESNDNKGWIKINDLKNALLVDETNEEKNENESENKDKEINNNNENKDKETNKNIFSNISIKELAIYIVVGTLLISLTAFVTIKLVNKNKKEKVDNKEVLNENTIKEETKKEILNENTKKEDIKNEI